MTTPTANPLRLRSLGLFARIGVAGFVISAIAGTAASGLFLKMHHANRDARPGFTLDDVRAHYHGIITPAPLLVSLDSGHPHELPQRERDLLTGWLRSDPATLSQSYDSLDLASDAPAEIMAVNCMECHARSSAGQEAAPNIPLEYWDDVEAISVSRDIRPVPPEILAASTHTHALGMAAIGIAITLLALLTAWNKRTIGVIVAATGAGLAIDLSGWWITRSFADYAIVVVAGGAGYTIGMSLLAVLILVDLCMPNRNKPDQSAS